MTKRKWMATLMLVLLTVGMMVTTVSAAESTPNTGDTPYSFYFEPTSGWRYTEWRNKTNNTSVYINLAQTPANYDRSGSRIMESGLRRELSGSKLKR